MDSETRVQIENELEKISEMIMELEYSKQCIGEITKGKEQDIVIPLVGGIFIKGKKPEVKDFLVNVGSGVLVKKTPEEAKDFIGARLYELNEYMKRLEAQLYSGEESE
ncbi:MAG TPA: prefoldin subunit alpha [Candidatus Woesearchaeota archaeon]|nr:prefoldin subunit alpha [Candidatus Woesearchaeota archaeon]